MKAYLSMIDLTSHGLIDIKTINGVLYVCISHNYKRKEITL